MTTTINPTVAWFTLASAKVVYIPLPVKAKKGKDGGKDTEVRFIRTGIRINMADGSWWFFRFGKETWSQHYPLVQATTRWNAPAVEFGTNKPIYLPERVERYSSFQKVVKEWGVRSPKLVAALLAGRDLALEEEAEKRAAARGG